MNASLQSEIASNVVSILTNNIKAQRGDKSQSLCELINRYKASNQLISLSCAELEKNPEDIDVQASVRMALKILMASNKDFASQLDVLTKDSSDIISNTKESSIMESDDKSSKASVHAGAGIVASAAAVGGGSSMLLSAVAGGAAIGSALLPGLGTLLGSAVGCAIAYTATKAFGQVTERGDAK